jgi:lipoyl(octanoyl) transferase
VAAIGVRVSRGVTMHGMALNVAPDLSHFALIVPCGLHGRDVTSMRAELGDACPSPAEAGRRLAEEVVRAVLAASAAGPVTRP